MTQTMNAAVLREGGRPGVLRLEKVPRPAPTDHSVLVRVKAISIEGGDLGARRRAKPTGVPQIVGYSSAGVVEALGPGATNFAIGDRVAVFNWAGSHAEFVAAPEAFVFAIPEDLEFGVAATVPVSFGTAHAMLFEAARVQPGETILVRGATGGVGVALVQLAAAAGTTVVATATGEERASALRELGAHHVLDGRTKDFPEQLESITNGHGIDVLADLVAGPQLSELIDSMADGGRIAFGSLAPNTPAVEIRSILTKRLTLTGVFLGKQMHEPRVQETVARLFEDVAAHRLTMPIAARYRLAEAAKAHEHVENGNVVGRVLIDA